MPKLAIMSDPAIDNARGGRHSYVLPTQMLSAREGEICTLLVEGHSLRQIGMRLNISVHTADTHARNAYAKLHVHNRVALIHRFSAQRARAIQRTLGKIA